MSPREQAVLDKMLGRAIHGGAQAFGTVASRAWLSFLKRLRPSYKPPTPEVIAGQLLDDEYQEVQHAAMDAIAHMPVICITIDGTTLATGQPLLNVTAWGDKAFFVEHFSMEGESETAAQMHMRLLSLKHRISSHFAATGVQATGGNAFLMPTSAPM